MVQLPDLLTIFGLYSAGRGKQISPAILRRVFGDVTVPNADGAGTKDDTAAFTAALGSGNKTVTVPPGTYKLTAPLVLPAGVQLVAVGRPTLNFTGPMTNGCIQLPNDGCTLRGLVINADKSTKVTTCNGVLVSGNDNIIEECQVLNAHDQGIKITGDRNRVSRSKVTGSTAPNIQILGPTVLAAPGTVGGSFNTIELCDVSGGGGFGIHIDDAAHDNRIFGCWCTVSGLELIGVTYSCYRMQIIGNHAEGTGDNGISVTGYDCTVNDNECIKCANSGIHLYGSNNTCTGNVCKNNNQSHSTFAGIDLGCSWGGLGTGNSVVGNQCLDDQAAPTQNYGINIGGAFYPAWAPSLSLASYPYVANGLAIYKRVAGATAIPASGAVAPTHTSGDVNDGTITWRYVATADTNLNSKHLQVIGNTCRGNVVKSYNDSSLNAHTVMHENLMVLDAAPGGGSTNPALPLQIITANGSPATLGLLGNPGDLMLRRGGSTGITAYLKEAGANDSSNWFPLVTRRSGTTAARPTGLGVGYDGYVYWDSTLKKPVWWDSAASGWKDATGAVV
jgi:hypothetical protein